MYAALLFTTKLSLNKSVSELSVRGKRILTSILSSVYVYGFFQKKFFFLQNAFEIVKSIKHLLSRCATTLCKDSVMQCSSIIHNHSYMTRNKDCSRFNKIITV